MTSRSKLLLGLALAFIIGAVIGLVGGGYGGLRSGKSSILDKCLYRDARVVQSHIVTLKHLRVGERDPAIELLEAELDDDLVSFDPWEPYSGLTDQTISEMNKAIRETKEYRLANPRKSNRPHVDKMVANLLSRGAYKHQ